MGEKTRAIGLATIVHRFMTNPHEPQYIRALRDEFGLPERTMRDWITALVRDFEPFVDPETGESRVEVRGRGAEHRIELRPPEAERRAGEREWETRIVAAILSRELVAHLENTSVWHAIEQNWRAALSEARHDDDFARVRQTLDRKVMGQLGPKLTAKIEPTILQRLVGAVLSQRKCILFYSSGKARGRRAMELEVEPYTLLVHRGIWYLVGKNTRSGLIRTYAIHRIQTVERTRRGFEYPTRREYDPERLFDGSFGIFHEHASDDKPPVKVHLRFAAVPTLVRYIQEREFHPSQRNVLTPSGELDVHFEIENISQFRAWVLGFGRDVEVISPRALFR